MQLQKYASQRALGAYIASTCQPEALFALSTAAQFKEPGLKETAELNKCMQWMMDNQSRGLNYIPLDMHQLKLYCFVDGSFANNKDSSSQIGYVIIIANEDLSEDYFILSGNIIH